MRLSRKMAIHSQNTTISYSYTGQVIENGVPFLGPTKRKLSKVYELRFLSSGTLTIDSAGKTDLVLVGAGGSGGNDGVGAGNYCTGAGGGAGGELVKTTVTISRGDYIITIGAGGIGGQDRNGNDGSNTTAFGKTAAGGQGGQYRGEVQYLPEYGYAYYINTGGVGGTGNGGMAGGRGGLTVCGPDNGYGSNPSLPGANGNKGFSDDATLYGAGGGAGAGGSFAGDVQYQSSGGQTGAGRGGLYKVVEVEAAQHAVSNTGSGGGGGAGRYQGCQAGGNGGSGIVIIRNAS